MRNINRDLFDDYFKNFSKNLVIMRVKLGFTRKKLADEIGICEATVWNIEHIDKRMTHSTIDTIFLICEYFDKTIEEMFDKPKKKHYKKAIEKASKIDKEEPNKNSNSSVRNEEVTKENTHKSTSKDRYEFSSKVAKDSSGRKYYSLK